MSRTASFHLLLLRLVLISSLVVMAAPPASGWAQNNGTEIPAKPQTGQPGPGGDAPGGEVDDDPAPGVDQPGGGSKDDPGPDVDEPTGDDPVDDEPADDAPDDDLPVADDPVDDDDVPGDDDNVPVGGEAVDDDDVPGDNDAPVGGGAVDDDPSTGQPDPVTGPAPADDGGVGQSPVSAAIGPVFVLPPAGDAAADAPPAVDPALSGDDGLGGDAPRSDDDDTPGTGVQIDPAFSDDDAGDIDRSDTIDDPRPNQAIVRLHPGVDGDAFAARFGITVLRVIPAENIFLVSLIPGPRDEDEAAALSADPDVAYAELNVTGQAPEARVRYFFPSGDGDTVPVDRPGLPPELNLPARSCVTGTGVVVAVLDTGLDPAHPLLAPSVLPNGVNMVDNTFDITDASNGVDEDGDGDIDEMTGHGTHVAGIVAQIAPDAGILPVKVLDSDGIGDAFFVAAGLYYALEQGADVVNLSLGSTFDSRTVSDAVAAATTRGVPVIAAIGNQGVEQPPEYPASEAAAVGVAATDEDGNKADFSNFNAEVDLSAPGVDIASASPGNQYVAATGTSMSTAIVTGAHALLLEQAGDLDPAAILQTFARATDPIPEPDAVVTGKIGAGRINIGAAVDCGADLRLPEPTSRR